MNNKQWYKLHYSLMDDTRLKVLGSQFGDNEALGIYVRLLKVLYKDYAEGIPWEPIVIEQVAEACKTDIETFERFVVACTSVSIGWFEFVSENGLQRLVSVGAIKEQGELTEHQLNGSLPPKPGKRKRGRPSKNEVL